jgi:ubiquinone/menaquinone biosynthesis C-methylase UbiE
MPISEISTTQRELATAYFAATVPRWESFYQSNRDCTVYETIYRARLSAALALVDASQLPAGVRCLDLGCGPGIATVALARRGFRVDAVDLIEAQLERVRQRAEEARLAHRVTTSVGDIHRLEFADGVFELVFVIGVLEWIEHPDGPLREIARVLKPGGRAILSVDNKWALRNLLDPVAFPPILPCVRHVAELLDRWGLRRKSPLRDYSYSIAEFNRLIGNAGLKKTKGVTVGFGPFSFFRMELPQALGLRLHHGLQRLASRDYPLLRSAGFVSVTTAEKPA